MCTETKKLVKSKGTNNRKETKYDGICEVNRQNNERKELKNDILLNNAELVKNVLEDTKVFRRITKEKRNLQDSI